MIKSIYLAVVVMLMLSIGGCVVAIGNTGGSHSSEVSAERATIAEINAIGKLHGVASREEAYTAIAAREGLGSAEQVYLVKAVFDKLHSDSSQEDILLVLIKNPSFSNSGKSEILNRLDRINVEHSKVNILGAISRRGGLAKSPQKNKKSCGECP